MQLDLTKNEHKVRLRVGDYLDLQWFPDSVYTSVLTDCNNNINKATKAMAGYILGQLTRSTKAQLAQMVSYDNQQFDQYLQFIHLTITNPHYDSACPIPYTGATPLDGDIGNFLTAFPKNNIELPVDDDMLSYAGINPTATTVTSQTV
jgi:hypothetical protein